MKAKMTGIDKLYDALTRGTFVTKSRARKIGVSNLSARVCELRSEGVRIDTKTLTAGNNRRVTGYVRVAF